MDECLLEAIETAGAGHRGRLDQRLALGTVGEAPGGDHETTAAEAAELARLAAEHRAFAPEEGSDWSGGADESGGPTSALRGGSDRQQPGQRTTCCGSCGRRSTAVCSCICGWPVRTAISRWPGSGSGEMARTAGAGMSVITTPAPPPPRCGRDAPPGRLGRLPDAAPARRRAGHRRTAARARYAVLVRGRGVHAESPRSPGPRTSCSPTGGVLDADGWREAVDEAGAGLRVGRFLVDSGRLTRGRAGAVPPGGAVRRGVLRPRPEQRRRPASVTGSRTGSDRSAPCRWPPWSARPSAAATCCTASGRTRRRTTPRSSGPAAALDAHRSRPASAPCSTRSTVSARPPRSPWPWAARAFHTLVDVRAARPPAGHRSTAEPGRPGPRPRHPPPAPTRAWPRPSSTRRAHRRGRDTALPAAALQGAPGGPVMRAARQTASPRGDCSWPRGRSPGRTAPVEDPRTPADRRPRGQRGRLVLAQDTPGWNRRASRRSPPPPSASPYG